MLQLARQLRRHEKFLQLVRQTSIKQLVRQTATKRNWLKPPGHETDLRIYNCVAKRNVPFILNNQYFVTWYTCGPTVYDSCHLGHASCYVKLDILQRILRHHFNLNIVSAMNITDIDDKIIAKSESLGKDWRDVARFYEAEFWADLKNLNVLEPNVKARVTDHIPKIVNYIEGIIKKRLAYVGDDNSVYMDVRCVKDYGKLQNISLDEQNAEEQSEREFKKSPMDFALWKARETGPTFPSPWGSGRPAWHIECSALAGMIFGDNVHIHAGGIDLRFPHHENEECQSCVYHDTKQWVNYWLHTGHLSIKGETQKMSNSLKNTISVKDMLKNYSSDDFRMACALSNYRSQMEYSDELMMMAKSHLNKFKDFRTDCLAYLSGKKTATGLDDSAIFENLKFAQSHVDSSIRDDFNTNRSITTLMDQISSISRCINAQAGSEEQIQTASSLDAIAAVSNYVAFILQSFGFRFVTTEEHKANVTTEQIDLNALLEDILNTRKSIRDKAVADKNAHLFEICDDLRKCLLQNGIDIRDHSKGSSWSFTKRTIEREN
uniref:cysteine--tRNA ligase n=1 Tax=Glossina brevipalpis TaxID=37001 RepID=A0A1A9WIT2_9MUSC